MPANPTIRKLYRALLENPARISRMLVLADALEKGGSLQLANAYRWAAENEKWPFTRTGHGLNGWSSPRNGSPRRVYDWNPTWKEEIVRKDGDVPRTAMISRELIRAIVSDKNRRYGGLNRAFIILGNALEKVNESRTGEVGVPTDSRADRT